MGILSRLAARRMERLDRARLELFTLEETELPVEAQPVKVTSGWPAPMGMPIRPSQTSDWKSIMVDWLSYFPFMAVLLLTDSHLRWVPYRSYRGRLVYQDSVDSHLAEGDPKKKGIYGKFPHATLGERAVALRKVKRVSLDIYDPSHLAVINVHLTEPTAVEGEGNWPAYQLEGLENVVPVPAQHFSEDGTAGPYLQFFAEDAMALTFAAQLGNALAYLEIPLQTESLGEVERAVWEERSSQLVRKRPWKPLTGRLRDA